MPSLVRDRSGVFFVVFSDHGKRIWRSLFTKDRREAYQRFLDRQSVDAQPSPPTLSKAKDEYLTFVKANLAPKTHSAYDKTLKHLITFLGERPLADIAARDIELYKIERRGKVSPNTVNHELRGIRAFFNRSKHWKLVDQNPCEGVKDIRIADSTRPYLSMEDLRKLLEHTKGTTLHDIILFAAMTGLRRGEVLNLTWNDIDLRRGTIVVQSSLTYQTKAGKIRAIPMNTTVKQLLEGFENRSGLLFKGDRGGIYNGNFLRARFKKAIRDCGLDPSLHFHSLRHTFASLLVKEGVSLYHVQKLLGHSSPRVTEIYAHLGAVEMWSSVEHIAF